jgi:putative colanic acid biosynthesis acetyltransferase WcaF
MDLEATPSFIQMPIQLSTYRQQGFHRGRAALVELAWQILRVAAFASFNPLNWTRVLLLKAFGATIGRGVVIKPEVKIKFPWKLSIGDYCWIGEGVWIDNLAEVTIAENSCVSQGTYVCTGSHDWKSDSFDLITKPISIGKGCWIGAKVVIAPGVRIHDNTMIKMGSVITRDQPAE